MTAPVRPSLEEIVSGKRPSLDEIVNDPMAKYHADYKSGKLQRDVASANEADDAEIPGEGEQMLAGLTSMSNAIPGATALQAGARSAVRGIPFAQATRDIRGAQADLPKGENTALSMIGALPTAAMVPARMGAVGAGALLGGAGEAANPDDMSGWDRAGRVAKGVGVGGALGLLGDLATTGVRAFRSKPLGAIDEGMRADMSAADANSYGAAEREGAYAVQQEKNAKSAAQRAIARTNKIVNTKALPAPGQSEVAKADVGLQRDPTGIRNVERAPTLETAAKDNYANVLPEQTPAPDLPHGGGQFQIEDYTKPRPVKLQGTNDRAVQLPPRSQEPISSRLPANNPLQSVRSALQDPYVAPYVKEVLASPSMAGVDEPGVLREVYRRMSERQGDIANSLGSKESTSLQAENRDIGVVKDRLLDASDASMPHFRGAVADHARREGELEALHQGADATDRIVRNKTIQGEKLERKSPEAFARDVREMTPRQADAARQGVLGRTKEQMRLSPNPFSGFGTLTSGYRVARGMEPLQTVDRVAGSSTFLDALRTLIAGGSGEIAGP